jgi:hypothetical protein
MSGTSFRIGTGGAFGRRAMAGLGIASLVGLAATVPAQTLPRYPLGPSAAAGAGIAPFFDGWYANPDGSVTLSFGFLNRNARGVVEIPIGPDNRVEPATYDGVQPTHFPVMNYRAFGGRRERGVFAVRVPKGFKDDVTWTLRHNGFTYSVPGRATSDYYKLSYTPQAAGSMMPVVRFAPDGPESKGREGVTTGPLAATVGTPLAIKVWMEDRGERAPIPVGMTWFKHQGPGEVTFEPNTAKTAPGGGEATTMVRFGAPGDYLLRVRVDNFGITDSTPGQQCCWTNGYVRVRVRAA